MAHVNIRHITAGFALQVDVLLPDLHDSLRVATGIALHLLLDKVLHITEHCQPMSSSFDVTLCSLHAILLRQQHSSPSTFAVHSLHKAQTQLSAVRRMN